MKLITWLSWIVLLYPGAERSVAVNLLEACAGNLDLAVGMHMDNGHQAGPSTAADSIDDNSISAVEDAGVRAPIPQRTEVLVEDDSNKLAFRMRRPRRFARSVFDGFRDFQTESYNFDESIKGKRLSKKRNLEDLFRPPVDMTHKGTFQSARDFGSTKNKWLLVNVQNVQEFPCQLLNRDVWSNQDARALIKDSFVFWQVYNDSEEGKRFMQFYKLSQWPYVAVIDPFTGESQVVWNKIEDGNVFCELAKDFLSVCPVPDSSQLPSAAKRQKREPSIVDASEQEQLEAAIQASLAETQKKADAPQYVYSSDSEADIIADSENDNEETFSDSDDVIVSTSPPSAEAASTNGVSRSKKSSPSSCALSSQAASKNSPRNKHMVNTARNTPSSSSSTSNRHKKLQSTLTPLSSSSHPSSSIGASASSSSLSSNRGKKLTSVLNNSEIKIIHEDGIDNDEDGPEYNVSEDEEDPRASAVWAASGPSTSTSSSSHLLSHQQGLRQTADHALAFSPPEMSEDNSLLDMLGTREAEVSTPQICTLDEDDDDDDDNDKDANDDNSADTKSQDSSDQDVKIKMSDCSTKDRGLGGENWKLYWGNLNDPSSKIMLRFPDNKREQVELPCSSQLKALSIFCAARGYPAKDYELVTNFPRKKLSQMAAGTTLKEAGLFPQDTVFVQDV
ncbi:ubx domain-containing protein 7-like [Plakobranchus ocellatus]|uniref:Ubx domain-containing protein 7-like n=1 Tax=Plakobranchus ocellatus TaxID=259542 RepID=A0AAV3YPG2_9GAST|nr:ubx domain-containing protein 7-like [Plakobranchus ocellatus]